MIGFEQLWNRELAPGLYYLKARRSPESICAQATEHGFRCCYIDGREASDKPSFLAACAKAMQFPSSFGNNWDALHDSIEDLSWLPASCYLLLFDRAEIFAADHPSDWLIAQEILQEAVRFWSAQNVSFYVLLRGRAAAKGLPRYP